MAVKTEPGFVLFQNGVGWDENGGDKEKSPFF